MQLGGKEAVPGEESFNNYIDNKKLPSSTSPETRDITPEDRDRALSKRHTRGAETKARLNSKMRVTAEPIRSTGEKRVEKTPQKVEEKEGERGREGARAEGGHSGRFRIPTGRHTCKRWAGRRQQQHDLRRPPPPPPPALPGLGSQTEPAHEISGVESK